jgi:hypothetical protein
VNEGLAEGRSGRRRRRVRNKVKLEPFYGLVGAAAGAGGWVPTLGLVVAAGLATDPEGGRGGLKMLHTLGHVHARRGVRRGLEWRRGALPEGAPLVADIGGYARMLDFLFHFQGHYIATDAIIDACGLHRDRPGVLGGLKVLEVTGLVHHRHPGPRVVQWCYGGGGDTRRPFLGRSGGGAPVRMLSLDADNGVIADCVAYVQWTASEAENDVDHLPVSVG